MLGLGSEAPPGASLLFYSDPGYVFAMNITAKPCLIRDVVAGDNYYYIPDYQRPYEWEESHIEDYWTDLTKAFERKEDGYFLDKLILVNRGGSKDFEVVDGRQRLTTTMILLALLRDFFFEAKLLERAEDIQNTCINHGKYRLTVKPEERVLFENYILRSVDATKDAARSNLPQPYKTAVTLLTEFIKDKEEELKLRNANSSIVTYLDEFYHFLLNEVVLIIITSDSLSSAYTIFETINTRGKDLDTKDLLKNLLLRRLEEEVIKHNIEYPTARKSFDDEKRRFLDTWHEIEKVKTSMDELLRHHRVVLVGDRSRKDLFREISEDIKEGNIATEVFMDNWKKSVDAYVELKAGTWHNEPLNGSAKKALLLLWNVGHGHWIPPLIAAWRDGIGRSDAERLIEGLERFCGLFLIAGHMSTAVRTILIATVRNLHAKQSIDDAIARLEAYLRKNRVVRDAMETLRGDVYHSSCGKYVLAKYEYMLLDDSIIREIPFAKTVQLEHILPQTMTDPSWTALFTKDEHDTLVNTLGNITLLAGSMSGSRKSKNQSASNKPFAEKVKIYRGETNKDGLTAFRMTQEVADYDTWTPAIIQERTEIIISTLVGVWHLTAEDIEGPRVAETSTVMDILTDEDIRFRLQQTIEREGNLAPRITTFLKTLLSDDRAFTRDELRDSLYESGVGGSDIGQAGKYFGNISQFITRPGSSHLRAILTYETEHDGPGAQKDNYRIRDEYRDLVRDTLAKL